MSIRLLAIVMSPHLVTRLAAAALILAAGTVSADWRDDYASAWLGEVLRRDNPENFWRDLVARPSRSVENASKGPRSWVANDENPWANTYGTPPGNRWRTTTRRPSTGIVRMCSCYLPSDARSWDGGPLTEADVTRLCHAQCY